jgi:hypothetical protein
MKSTNVTHVTQVTRPEAIPMSTDSGRLASNPDDYSVLEMIKGWGTCMYGRGVDMREMELNGFF